MTHDNYPHEQGEQDDRQTNELNNFTIPDEDRLTAISRTLLEEVDDDDEVPLVITDDVVVVPKEELVRSLAALFQTFFQIVDDDEF